MKTALVTGGSRGIGSAIALGLGKNFHVVVGYANSEDKANDVVQEIVAAGGSASTVQIDISNAESVDTAFSTVEKEYNSVDVLINNAGITQDNILPRMKEAEWLEVIQTNLTGKFLYIAKSYQAYDEKQMGKNYIYIICSWIIRQPRSGKLCCIKGWINRVGKIN